MTAAYLPKRPRHYAAEIIALPSVAARRQALSLVPTDWQAWVGELVADHFAKRHFLRLYRATIQPSHRINQHAR